MTDGPQQEQEFDFRSELISLYKSAQNFDEKHKALTLMEKVGGFVKKVKTQDERDVGAPDPVAARVLKQINAKNGVA